MKYIIYNLVWDNEGRGDQPYTAVANNGAELEGGIISNEQKEYFGYLHGTDEQCLKAIESCKNFNMRELTSEEALSFFEATIPIGTEIIDPMSMYSGNPEIKYVDYPTIGKDGKVEQNYK